MDDLFSMFEFGTKFKDGKGQEWIEIKSFYNGENTFVLAIKADEKSSEARVYLVIKPKEVTKHTP